MKKKRTFLQSMTVLTASLIATAGISASENQGGATLPYTSGDFVLERSLESNEAAGSSYHRSHMSHQSHRSHQSHYSHYSGY